MTRTTIDYGIDLGTTNSAIAVLEGTRAQIIKNVENQETTPSAVWIDRGGNLVVGRRAREHRFSDGANATAEFKLKMGTSEEVLFARNGRRMKPEELSAEVLKSLKQDVQRRFGESITAAVITVPAAFELPQCEATRRAAELAGLTESPLLQEPIAAALAYGFQSEATRIFWLVYDLGGGTFDAAVITVRDGVLSVVSHGGDNRLGGKLIDWDIVEQIFAPALVARYKLPDFRRGNPRWERAFAKLKLAAEEAKIILSATESYSVFVEQLSAEDDSLVLEYELRREEVERLAEPYLVRSINICRRVLAEKQLEPGDIHCVLLVGGPTLMPYVRERLADPKDGLGIQLEFRVDPLTVVAQGAAVFAGTQRVECNSAAALPVPAEAGHYRLEVDYKPIGADEEPIVGGRVVAPDGASLAGWSLEIVNTTSQVPWRSGKIALGEGNGFVVTLWAERGGTNEYAIELFDPTGTKRPLTPDRIKYIIGTTPEDPPLSHSIGLALANNRVAIICPKGAPLPTRKRDVRQTTISLRRGQSGQLLQIPVIAGENAFRADRNRLVGTLEIPAHEVARDVPVGSEVEITVEIDRSQLVRATAYIPLLDCQFERVMKLQQTTRDLETLREEFRQEKRRLEQVRRTLNEHGGDPRAEAILERIEREQMLRSVETALSAAIVEAEAAHEAQGCLLRLKSEIDALEDLVQWPAAVAEAEAEIRRAREVVDRFGSDEDRPHLRELERELEQAIRSGDPDLLAQKKHDIGAFIFEILEKQPGFWVAVLEDLEGSLHETTDPGYARRICSRARKAIDENDLPALKAAVRELVGLLPPDKRGQVGGIASTII